MLNTMFSSRWSPNGQFIFASSFNQRWSTPYKGPRVVEDGSLRLARERIVRWNSSVGVYIVSFLKLKRNFRL